VSLVVQLARDCNTEILCGRLESELGSVVAARDESMVGLR
jgi:hypothetical protein